MLRKSFHDRFLCVTSAFSAVHCFYHSCTAETQRTQRLRRENFKLSRCSELCAASARILLNLATRGCHGTARQHLNNLARAASANRQTRRTLTLARQPSQLVFKDPIFK